MKKVHIEPEMSRNALESRVIIQVGIDTWSLNADGTICKSDRQKQKASKIDLETEPTKCFAIQDLIIWTG